jgi:YesN/AraC family two-component response regulator
MITDVRMPGLNGFELAQQAKLLRPNLHIIYMSGYYNEKKEGFVPRYGAFLQKPVRADALLATIEQELIAR